MIRIQRTLALLVLALVAGLFAAVGQPTAPPAQAAEGPVTGSNYVPLAKPARILNRAFRAGEYFSFTAIGTAGIPRVGTTGLVVVVTGWNNTDNTGVVISSYSSTGWNNHWVDAVMIDGGEKHVVANTVTLPVDETLATNHLTVREDWDASPVNVAVDVVGYYTKNAVGGGFVPVRHTTLFDTRANAGAAIPAGGQITMPLTGGIVPAGASSVFLDLLALNATANGSIIAVPFGTDLLANPVMRFWSGHVSNLVAVKVSADGRATFKNTSTAPVHLLARAEGYTTSSPGTGAGWHPARMSSWELTLAPSSTTEITETGGFWGDVPDSGVAAVFVNLDVYGATAAGHLKIYPSGQARQTTTLIYFNPATSRHRLSGAVLVPGSNGKITIENASTKQITLVVSRHAWFSAPTDYATEGGRTEISVARTASGPCYGYLDPTAHDVRFGCAEALTSGEIIFPSISPAGQRFSGPVSVAVNSRGRVVVTALHAPDGEVWTWEIPHTLGAVTSTAVRSFRHILRPPVTATLPNGEAVGFTTDIEGRVWAIDLDVAAPSQPTWKMLEIPGVSLAGELSAASTPSGVRLGAITVDGDVLSGLYASSSSTSAGWQSLGFSGAELGTRVAIGVSKTGQARVGVARPDDTLWSANVAPAGGTVDGWHLVNTVYDGAQVPLAGSPVMTYDPVDGKNILFFRSEAAGRGGLHRVREEPADSGRFVDAVFGVGLGTTGISSDVTAWDFRTDPEPRARRYGFAYFDSGNAKKVVISACETTC